MSETEISFAIPKNFSVKDVADVLAAFLLGASAFLNNEGTFGPFPSGKEGKFQLDGSNDYWVEQTGDNQVTLICRYRGQTDVISPMVGLFKARYLPDQDVASAA